MIDTLSEETALVGAICIDSKMVRVICRYVQPEDFFYANCRLVYETALEYDKDGKAFDPLIAANALEEQIPEIRSFLAQCIEITPTTANTEEYAQILKTKADERWVREEIGRALNEKSGEELSRAVAEIAAMAVERKPKNRLKKLDAVLEKTWEGFFQKSQSRVDTGYGRLDGVLKGMWGDELILLGARPAVGKSAFALSIAENVAAKTGKAVMLYSLEMNDTQIGERILSRHTERVVMDNLIDRNLTEEQAGEVAKAWGNLSWLPIYIDDSPGVKPSKVREQALTMRNLGLIIIDYGGLMKPDRKRENRNQELGAVSGDLKNLAKELDVPVMMLAQLSRKVGDTEKPTVRELRDSGELEQNADKCVFLWNLDKESGKIGVSVAKNRRGKTGELVFYFDGDHMRYVESEERYQEPPKGRGRGGFHDDEF